MSKITFRADDDLVRRIEALEASKSEVMREALRAYLEDTPTDVEADMGSFDALITNRIDRRIDERLAASSSDVNVNVTIEDDRASYDRRSDPNRESEPSNVSTDDHHCRQCGETVDADHVYCPNCGEKAVNRAFCDCGDEVRSDWAFCPGCGRRTPAADVLE
jgi:RNA polymerase subunit RPABC4/transcription elongation factor Spt4